MELKATIKDYTLKQSWTQEQLEEALDAVTILGHAERMDFDSLWAIKLDTERSIDCIIYPVGYDAFMHDGFYKILKNLKEDAENKILQAKSMGDKQELYKLETELETIGGVIEKYKGYRKNHK